MNNFLSKILSKNKKENYIQTEILFNDLSLKNNILLFCYLHMCIFLDSSVVFLSNDDNSLNNICYYLSRMFPLNANLFGVNTIQFLNSSHKVFGIQTKNLNKINLPKENNRIFISKFSTINDYKNSETVLYSANSSYSFIKLQLNPDLFIESILDKSSVLNSINKLSSLIYIKDDTFDIYEFSWLSNAEILNGQSINDLDMFNLKKLSGLSDTFITESNILEKYTIERGINKDYCTKYFKKLLDKYKTSKNFGIFNFNSFSDI
jgi:hypothetical protein